jgi:phospholipid transport system transporter-binding protein
LPLKKTKTDVSETRATVGDGRISVTGPLTFQSVPALVSEAGEWLTLDGDVIEVDLSGVPRADSAGVALLLEWWNTFHAVNRRIAYTGVPDQVEDFIRINGLDSVLLK